MHHGLTKCHRMSNLRLKRSYSPLNLVLVLEGLDDMIYIYQKAFLFLFLVLGPMGGFQPYFHFCF